MSRRKEEQVQMHAIIFCINATCTSQDLNYQIQEHIAKLGILQDSQNSYNQMVLVGTKAETLDEVDRDNWVRYKAKPLFEKADRGEGNWCFTTPIGERDATTGQYPDLNTKDLEEILRTMPIRKIYFEAGFTDEFLRNMLETTSAVPPDQIEAIITEIHKLRSTIADLKNRVEFSNMPGKEAIKKTRADLNRRIDELKRKDQLTKAEEEKKVELGKKMTYLTGLTHRRVLNPDLINFVALKTKHMPNVKNYKLDKPGRQWILYQFMAQTGDYDLSALKQSGAPDKRMGCVVIRTGNKRGRPRKKTSTTPQKGR